VFVICRRRLTVTGGQKVTRLTRFVCHPTRHFADSGSCSSTRRPRGPASSWLCCRSPSPSSPSSSFVLKLCRRLPRLTASRMKPRTFSIRSSSSRPPAQPGLPSRSRCGSCRARESCGSGRISRTWWTLWRLFRTT